MPIEDQVALCNAVGADLWIGLDPGTTGAEREAIERYVAEHLRPGLSWYVEPAGD